MRLTLKDFDCLKTNWDIYEKVYLILTYVLRTSTHYQTKYLNLDRLNPADLSVFYFSKRIYVCLHMRVKYIMVHLSMFNVCRSSRRTSEICCVGYFVAGSITLVLLRFLHQNTSKQVYRKPDQTSRFHTILCTSNWTLLLTTIVAWRVENRDKPIVRL